MIDFSKGSAGGAPEQAETEYFSSENAAALIRFVQDAWAKSRDSFAQLANSDVTGESLEIKRLAEYDTK